MLKLPSTENKDYSIKFSYSIIHSGAECYQEVGRMDYHSGVQERKCTGLGKLQVYMSSKLTLKVVYKIVESSMRAHSRTLKEEVESSGTSSCR